MKILFEFISYFWNMNILSSICQCFFSTWQKVSFYTLILKRRFKGQIKYIVREIKIPCHWRKIQYSIFFFPNRKAVCGHKLCGLKLGALKDGNILLVIWLKYSIWCNFLSYGALLLNFCICVTEEDVHIITQRKFRSELIRKSYST